MKISTACKKRELSETWRRNVAKAIILRCAKAVYCQETGETFESVSSAARSIGISPIQVSRVCRGLRYSVHGLTFAFCEEQKF